MVYLTDKKSKETYEIQKLNTLLEGLYIEE